MALAKKIVGIVYDFDGTLSPGNMQEYTFIPYVGSEPKAFWDESKEFATKNSMDPILAYMYLMVQKAMAANKPAGKDELMDCGKNIDFFPGVDSWFSRINSLGATLGLRVEHYIVSSGLLEIIRGCKISNEFKEIYASSFIYDVYNRPIWPAQVVNYTTKTQYIFRINKGLLDPNDDSTINKYIEPSKRRIPFQNMVYIGDGMTDVPCMSLVKRAGGHSIAVYPPKKRNGTDLARSLLSENRCNLYLPANYSQNSELEGAVKSYLSLIQSEQTVKALENSIQKGIKK